MKVPGTNIDIRVNEPSEEIEMVAHSGVCKYCGGIVKMMRDTATFKLQPDNCHCLLCGQRYHVDVKGSIHEWELRQWGQKELLLNLGDIKMHDREYKIKDHRV